jgi:hypothetical protein
VVFIRQDLLVPETSRKIENSPSQA